MCYNTGRLNDGTENKGGETMDRAEVQRVSWEMAWEHRQGWHDGAEDLPECSMCAACEEVLAKRENEKVARAS